MAREIAGLIVLVSVVLGGTVFGETITLSSKQLEVIVDSEFPRVISYKHIVTGGVLYGQAKDISEITLNGVNYTPEVTSGKKSMWDNSGVAYKLKFPGAGNITIDASIVVSGETVVFTVDKIRDNELFRVNVIEIPEHNIVSVKSSQAGASLAIAKIDANKAKCADTYFSITKDTKVSEGITSCAYAILSTETLAASVETNSVYDYPNETKGPANERYAKGANKTNNGRVRYQFTKTGNVVSAGLSSGQWTYRPKESDKTEPLPFLKVVVTGDKNGDSVVDWQDGAIAFRDIMNNPKGWQNTPDRVAQHIVFNFASAAGNPFHRSLDNVKRIYYITDGLGQLVLHKGYQSEGHDSAHSDFGGNIGIRPGGKKEMNVMVNEGRKWGADFGVHLNCTESYPEAKSFSDTFVNPKRKGWGWLDQSYHINHRQDLVTGNFAGRIKELKRDVPGLAFIYMDVYFGDGWEGLEMARTMQETGFDVTTEFPRQIEHSAIWSHWSVDMTYGPDTSRGVNSQIIRFIRNHQKDMFLIHPLLGHAEIGDFEGWQGRVDFHQFLDKVYTATLPAKYLQHFLIDKWSKNEIKFTDGVRVTDVSGKRQIFKGDRKVLDGAAYLLPWEPKAEKKLYHWNVKGGETAWELPKSWKSKSVKLYLLTDTGRELVGDLDVVNGKISIDAKAKTPYVVYQYKAPADRKANWGQGSFVKDPGFNDKSMSDWRIDGDSDAVSIAVDELGRSAVKIAASKTQTRITQKVTGLKTGVYSASVWVEVEDGKRMAMLVAGNSACDAKGVWTDESFALNQMGNYGWNRTRMQRMQIAFEVGQWKNSAYLTLVVEAGESAVRFDDVRIISTVATEREGYIFFEDFENVDEGWMPFVKGNAGGVTDPTTHLSELHAPYTNSGWNDKLIDDTIEGQWSLKSHNERFGLVYQTIPQTVRFMPGRKYEVSFDYQCSYDDDYSLIIGAGGGETQKIISAAKFKETRETKTYKVIVEPGERDDVWVGVNRDKFEGKRRVEMDLVIDNLAVRELAK